MALSHALLVAALLCVFWSVAMIVLLTRDLRRRGQKTPWPLMGVLFFRNVSLYRKLTMSEEGNVGPLFKAFVIPINLAWACALLALVLR